MWYSERGRTILRLHVSANKGRRCEATLHLLFRNFDSNQSPGKDDVMHLGVVKLGPFLDPCVGDRQTLRFQDGTATVGLQVSLSWAHLQSMSEMGMWQGLTQEPGDLELVDDRDTRNLYLMATIPLGNYRHGSATRSLNNTFIAPVRLVYKSLGLLHLLSPLSGGGHLLSQVQRERRFPIEQARLCAAQLVCALEALHDMGIAALLSSENVLLDPFGNIHVCTPALFATIETRTSQLAYPPPEILRGGTAALAGDWWILGAFLYEMVTGLPPFYDSDIAERDHKVLTALLDVPGYVQSTAADILLRLLDKDPTRRLGGVNGVSEIKSHEFFQGLDWHDLVTKRFQSQLSPFIPPPDLSVNIFHDPATTSEVPSPRRQPAEHLESDGYLYKLLDFGSISKARFPVGQVRSSSEVSDPVLPGRIEEPSLTGSANLHGQGDESSSEPIKERLKEALYKGWDMEAVTQIFDNCAVGVTDLLNSSIVRVREARIAVIVPQLSEEKRVEITPLEWTVELGRIDLVRLFLDHGADPDRTYDEVDGPGLIRATRKRNLPLAEVLVSRTSRIFCVRALCLAVELKDTLIAKALLSQGVPSDFDEADRLLPSPSRPQPDAWCGYADMTPPKPHHHLSPLVRAARQGDADMVRLLLDYGADANAAYHSLDSLVPEYNSSWQEELELKDKRGVSPRCGRVVQLAMTLGYHDVVAALLAGGADIDLPHPEWNVPKHTCYLAHRSLYLQITAGLEDARRAMVQGTTRGKVAESF